MTGQGRPTGPELKALREAAGIGVAELARAMGYAGRSAHTNVWHIEQRALPSEDHVRRYLAALDQIKGGA